MDIEAVASGAMPKALGPYSQAVRAGDLLFVAGQTGIDSSSGTVPDGGFDAEARQAFVNLAAVLRAAGSDLNRVVKTTVFLTDAQSFAAMNELYGEFFPANPPVRSTPIVALPKGLLISIEAIAAAGTRREAG